MHVYNTFNIFETIFITFDSMWILHLKPLNSVVRYICQDFIASSRKWNSVCMVMICCCGCPSDFFSMYEHTLMHLVRHCRRCRRRLHQDLICRAVAT